MTTTTTEQGGQLQKSCILISTLVKVMEQFLQTVNHLQSNLVDNSPTSQAEFLKSVMEHYDRLNMVIRVMKIAYPSISDGDEQSNNLVEDATRNASFTAINTLCRIKDQMKPAVVTPQQQQQQQQQQQETVTQSMEVNHHQNNVKVEPIDNTIYDEIVQNYVLNQYNESTTAAAAATEEEIMTDNNQHEEDQQHQASISSVQFLDQFEDTARNFAKQNSIDLKEVWESLLIHALPNDKLIWAQKAILRKNMDWYDARKYYLREYPNIKQEKQKPFVKPQAPNNLRSPSEKQVMMKSAIRVNQPSPPVTSNPETKKQIMERQSIYAEQLLTLAMKEYETMEDYNSRFKRYSTAACMNLTDPSLFKRYVSSLMPKYRELVSDVLKAATSQPKNLDDMMKMSARIVSSQETSSRVHARSCWKHVPPTTTTTVQAIDDGNKKRTNVEEFHGSRPLKKFSSSCA